MADHDRRLNPLQPIRSEWKSSPERRRNGEWMDSRTDVVDESGHGELGRPRSAANSVFCFEHYDFASRLRKDDGSAETVRPGTDYNCINHSYDEDSRADVGVLVLTLVIRARARSYLPRRIHRSRKAVRALAGRARSRARGPLVAGGSVPGVAEPVLSLSQRQRLLRVRLPRSGTFSVRAQLASAADGWRGIGCGVGGALDAVSLVRQRRPDVLQLWMGDAAVRGWFCHHLRRRESHGTKHVAHLDLEMDIVP